MSAQAVKQTDEPRHPIQVVSRRTGVTQDSLRAWEKRYGAVEPHRAPGGRRLYTDADVERLILLRRATDAGRRIGQVAGLPTEELATLVAQDEKAIARAPRPQPRPSRSAEGSSPEAYLAACLDATRELDYERLRAALGAARLELTMPVLLEQVLTPFLQEIGEQWHRGELKISQEHLASSVVRSLLSGQESSRNVSRGAPAAVVTTPPGQRHELGALMAAVTASTEGWRVVYLGADLPVEEMASAVRQAQARALLLSMVYPSDDPYLGDEIRRLRALVGDSLAIVAGGRSSGAYRQALEEIDARIVDDLPGLRAELDALRV
jgi:DNA-binding transcriptional MerR regulator/methylmalonyl-CoA mutase cobalamin-binding subunit